MRLDASLDSISAFIHRSTNSIRAGVAVSSWSASTCLVNGSRRARRMIPSIFLFMERFGSTGSTGAKGRSPDDAAAEGFLGGMKVESVHPGRREEYTRGEVLALIDEYIHWRNHDASSNRSVG